MNSCQQSPLKNITKCLIIVYACFTLHPGVLYSQGVNKAIKTWKKHNFLCFLSRILSYFLFIFTQVTYSIALTEMSPVLTLCSSYQRVWAIRQPEPPVWSVSPASWTVCPRWSPAAARRLWETPPPSPPAAPTRSPARRTAPDPGPFTTSCEGNCFDVDCNATGGRAAFYQTPAAFAPRDKNWFCANIEETQPHLRPCGSFYVVHEIVNM